jgi:peroxiredoxin
LDTRKIALADVRKLTDFRAAGFSEFKKPCNNLNVFWGLPMTVILLIARLLVSGVFLAAGAAKCADLKGTRKSLVDFGLPEWLARAGAVLLPLSEIVIALALIPARLAWCGSVAALALLALFILGISTALLRGRKPDCHCFGQLHSKPIGGGLLVRNIALAAVPAFSLLSGEPFPPISALFQGLTPGEALLLPIAAGCLALLCFQSWLIFQLMRQGGRMLLRLDALEKQAAPASLQPPSSGAAPPPGLPAGQPAPDFTLEALDGEKVSLAGLLAAGKPLLLLFTHPDCGPCIGLLAETVRWQQEYAGEFRLVLISQGDAKENRAKLKGHNPHLTLRQKEAEISSAYHAHGTPSAVLIRPDGAIGSSLASGAEAIRGLVATIINQPLTSLISNRLGRGEAAPPLVYPDLEGRMFSLTALRGKPAALLFWNPACGFCQQMLADIQAWEKHAGGTGMQVLMISTGSVEDNRKLGLKSGIVLDPNFSAGRVFGAGGTPSGLLLDSDVRVASEIAVGRQQILESVLREAPVAAARA